jgi:hypothetical protein
MELSGTPIRAVAVSLRYTPTERRRFASSDGGDEGKAVHRPTCPMRPTPGMSRNTAGALERAFRIRMVSWVLTCMGVTVRLALSSSEANY